MADPDNFEIMSISSFETIALNTPIQKRALSYARTINLLFNQIMCDRQAADRVVADYFAKHKKHGSKDRRIIRETLFALFRWWGWLQQLRHDYNDDQTWFAALALTARIENHQWHQISAAWKSFAKIPTLDIPTNTEDLATLADKQELLQRNFKQFNFAITDLVPQWFWQYYPNYSTADDGHETLIATLNSRPPIWGRLQRGDVDEAIANLIDANIDASKSEFFTDAIKLGHKSINLSALKLYTSGALEIQDIASQVVGHVCAPLAHESWWDACCGAGGKSLQLQSLMLRQNDDSTGTATGTITASDIRLKPLQQLLKRAKRADFDQIKVVPWLDDKLPVPSRHFDGVLVDAPCSGTGTWRRNPDMRWTHRATTITEKPAQQLAILERASAAVKPSGILVYATCSICPLENEEVIEAFLKLHPEFVLQPLTHPFNSQVQSMLTILPDQANSDGMFIAKMRQCGSVNKDEVSIGSK